MALTLQKIQQDILTTLGASSIEIELLDVDIDKAITDALEHFDARIPGLSVATLSNVSANTGRYVVSHRNLIDVIEVNTYPEHEFLSLGIGGEPLVLVQDGLSLSEIPVGRLTQIQMRYIQLKKLLSDDIIWEGRWEYNATTKQREYALYIDVPSTTSVYRCAYEFAWHHTADDNLETGVPTIANPHHWSWIEKYATAVCKEILGHIRDKFKGLPSVDGMDMQVDGMDMVQEGLNEQVILEDELLSMQAQIPPLAGGG